MGKTYASIRMPKEIYDLYLDKKLKMETDISNIMGKPIRLTMPKVFRAIVDPKINENYIQIDKTNLLGLVKEKKNVRK